MRKYKAPITWQLIVNASLYDEVEAILFIGNSLTKYTYINVKMM